MAEELLPTEIELNFEKDTLYKLYSKGEAGEITPERWERVRREIRFEDVVSDLTGHTGGSIRCPFHGSDSRPSFWLYKGTNDGYCFGCPPKEQYYDHVRFVSRFLEINKVAALRWLEKKWDLPAMPTPEEDVEEEYTVQLGYLDLQEPYILKAIKETKELRDVELAEDYLRYYFEAAQQAKWAEDAKKQGEIEDATAMVTKAATTLARVLGKEELNRIFARKKQREGK